MEDGDGAVSGAASFAGYMCCSQNVLKKGSEGWVTLH